LVAIVTSSEYGASASAICSSLTPGPYASAVSMNSTPSSSARRSTRVAFSPSFGRPQTPGPHKRMPPKPKRLTRSSLPMVIVDASFMRLASTIQKKDRPALSRAAKGPPERLYFT
jgi:hypothetical protein